VPDGIMVSSVALAVSVLNRELGDSRNGITKLYSHLLATKLNIAAGASSSAVATVIADADVFLATHHWSEWATLSAAQQAQVLAWKDTLDAFNNGQTGPGACD
jgi:LPS O-antigen subunit length determinant protein (WzzB/FepE family)